MADTCTCIKCGRTKKETEFFKMKTGDRCDMCKQCLTINIDNRKPETFLWILEKFNVPYIENTWISMCNKIYLKNPAQFGPSSVIGQYLRSMNMSQYKQYTYADSDKLNYEHKKLEEEAAARREANKDLDAEVQKKYEAGEISDAEYKTYSAELSSASAPNQFIATLGLTEDNLTEDLTDEDVKYLAVKWGVFYKPAEWIKMEELYQRYAAENDLNTDREDTLKKICKTSIKMDEALDIGDIQTYKNLSAVYDQLRKSAKFTEAQNKEDQVRSIDSIGELVAFVEREGGVIPGFEDPIEYPKDKVDFTIRDMQNYVNRLVRDELGLGDLIESFIKKTEDQKNQTVEDIIRTAFDDPETSIVTDEDMEDFQRFYMAEIEKESQRLAESFGV